MVFEETGEDIDACGAETLETLASYGGIRVLDGGYYALDSGFDDGFGAGAGAAGVIAWLEIDVEGGAAGFFSGRFDGEDFGVITPYVLVETFSDDLALADEDAAY